MIILQVTEQKAKLQGKLLFLIIFEKSALVVPFDRANCADKKN
jgi:hypothetical protein